MKYSPIPGGYQRITPYLILENAAGFIEFTQKVFGAELKSKMMRTEDVIMHGELVIANSSIMFADITELYSKQTSGLFIYVDNCDEVYQSALLNGAISIMEPSNQDYGRSCGVKDPFENMWWITGI